MLFASDASTPGAVVRQYKTDAGAWQAIALRDTEPARAQIHRHVLLIDTSASQVGFVRETGIRLVSDLARQLPATDHVHLVAMDTSCQSLTRGFVTPVSAEFAQALRRLEFRTPLGATNLRTAMKTVIEQGDGQPTSVLWIGDGMSSLRAFSTEEIAEVTGRLSASDMTVHSVVPGAEDQSGPAGRAGQSHGWCRAPAAGRRCGHSGDCFVTAGGRARIDRIAADGRRIEGLNSSSWLRSDRHAVVLEAGAAGHVNTIEAGLQDGRIVRWDQVAVEEGGAELKQLCEMTGQSDGFVMPLHRCRCSTPHQRTSITWSVRLPWWPLACTAWDMSDRLVWSQNRRPNWMRTISEVTTMLTALRESDPFGFGESDDDDFTVSDRSSDALSDVESMIQVKTQRLQQTTAARIDEANSYALEQPEYADHC